MIKPKVLLSGSEGMLGHVIGPYLLSKGYRVRGFDLKDGDISDINWLEKLFSEWKPDIFCNCAAYTKVDDAETNQEEAFRVNGEALTGIIDLCAKEGAVLVHFSTDYVFDGTKSSPYVETDPPNPLSVYGKSKLAGERNILSQRKGYNRFYIIRTSWLYGHHGPNFISTILRLAAGKKDLDIVSDQKGSPTSCQDLAEAVYYLLKTETFGLYHFSGEGSCSWYELALKAIEIAKRRDFRLKIENIRPVKTENFRCPAPRPMFSVLSKSKYKDVTGKKVEHWIDSLERFIVSTGPDSERQYII
ncbi:MAG: dTDP-4-dehydrorhamnose reductase [bacterium]